MMTEIVPKHWGSWDFRVVGPGLMSADVAIDRWCEKGELTIEGAAYRVYREEPFCGAFILEGDAGELARAEKPRFWRREFEIHHAGKRYALRPESWFGRTFVLFERSHPIGSLVPRNALSRQTWMNLPEELPMPLRLFIVWLTMISWRRDVE